MNETIISDIVRTVVFLLPVLALVWKGSKIASRVDEHEKDFKEMQGKIEHEKQINDSNYQSMMSTLSEIQKSIVRIETKLEIEK